MNLKGLTTELIWKDRKAFRRTLFMADRDLHKGTGILRSFGLSWTMKWAVASQCRCISQPSRDKRLLGTINLKPGTNFFFCYTMAFKFQVVPSPYIWATKCCLNHHVIQQKIRMSRFNETVKLQFHQDLFTYCY